MPEQDTYAIPRLDIGRALEEFRDNEADWIATAVLPIFPTQKQAATFSKITRESITRRSPGIKRAPDAAYARDSYGSEDASYACEEYGLEEPLSDVTRAKFKSNFA